MKYSFAFSLQIVLAVALALSSPVRAVRGEAAKPTLSSQQRGAEPGEYIPHWDEAPSSLADYPQRDNRTTVVDPWLYTDRLGLYKILLRATSADPTLGRAGNTANVLWGLPLQHGWQFATGRLRDFSGEAGCDGDDPPPSSTTRKQGDSSSSWNNSISPCSWWASMNYYLSVAPFLGAVEAGVFAHWPRQIEMSASPQRPEDYCTSLVECKRRFPSLINNWTVFFKTLKYRADSPRPQPGGAAAGDTRPLPTPPPTLSPRERDIIGKLWAAHTRSLETAGSLSEAILPLMPEPERRFGLSWANLIDYIAAVDFVTDLNTTAAFQKSYLPMRVLAPGDKPPRIPDFSRDVNFALYALETALSIDQKTGDRLKHAWQALMCSPASQARGRYLIANVMSPLDAVWSVCVLLWLYVTTCA